MGMGGWIYINLVLQTWNRWNSFPSLLSVSHMLKRTNCSMIMILDWFKAKHIHWVKNCSLLSFWAKHIKITRKKLNSLIKCSQKSTNSGKMSRIRRSMFRWRVSKKKKKKKLINLKTKKLTPPHPLKRIHPPLTHPHPKLSQPQKMEKMSNWKLLSKLNKSLQIHWQMPYSCRLIILCRLRRAC